MEEIRYHKKPYVVTMTLILAIFLFIFIGKGIFPFGKNSLIWGDMHDQITAFYYHFYDSFHGNSSLLIDFSTSGGINFFGILTYYILSPITFILLLFSRENIYLAVSIVVALKILISSLTCLYFIRYYFKKLPSFLSVFLSICYAFSGYSLSMYQITPWIDIMYLFPLLMIGFKKLLDLEKPTWYIVTLTISIICCFYISIMLVLFILLSAYIYLLVYKNREERKKAILSLGISTILSLLIALFVLIPSYLQISVSSRLGFSLGELLNSKAGPLTDKLSFFMFGGIVYLGVIFLIKNYKKDSKFLLWYISTCLIVLIPLIIEPINKFWHFGSYAFFPYRFGFIMIFFLIIGACQGYCLELKKEEKRKITTSDKTILALIITVVTSLVVGYCTYINYGQFQAALFKLTLSINHGLLWFLLFTTLLILLSCYLIYRITVSWNRVRILCMAILTLVHIITNSFLYLGIDFNQEKAMSQYENLTKLSRTYEEGNYYRVKNLTSNFIMNSGMVMKYHALDHFTSLTDRNNLRSLKKLGYSSMWVKTYSKGGTLFSDAVLGNRYLISKSSIESPYYQLVGQYGNLKFYQLFKKPSYGYLVEENARILDKKNSFDAQNLIYQTIQKTEQDIFTTYDDWQLHNIQKGIVGHKTTFDIIDETAYNYVEQTISFDKKQVLYLEILKDLDNMENSSIYQRFNIYVNDQLFRKNALTETNNGVINLGTYEQEEVNVKIELLGDVELDNLTLATMDTHKYETFLEETYVPLKIKYNRNHIEVEVTSDQQQILVLPISYNHGYHGKVNQKKVELESIFENFLGIPLEKGVNKIDITFTPPSLKITTGISLITFIGTLFLLHKDRYFGILNSKVLQKVANCFYLLFYALLVLGVYVGLTIVFILSYFVYFHF